MKIGDRLEVQIDGVSVAEAFIEDIEDGHAIIVIPATRLVAQVRQNLDLAATAESNNPDRVLGGIESPDEAVAATQAPAEQPSTISVAPSTQSISTAPNEPVASLRDMNFDTSVLDKE